MVVFEAVKAKITGRVLTDQEMERKKTDMSIIATAHNFAEILAVVILLLALVAEGVCHLLGVSKHGDQADVMSPYFRESGIFGGWRGAISPEETALVLVVVLACRILCTPFEEKLGASRFPPRTAVVQHYLRLLASEGPASMRVLCWACVVSCLFTNVSELCFYGKSMAAMRDATDD